MNSKPTNEAQPQSSQGQELPQTLSECHEVITRQAVQLSQLQEQVGVLQEQGKFVLCDLATYAAAVWPVEFLVMRK